MLPLSEIPWGPIDAVKPDPQFINKWIEPENIRHLLAKEIWMVTGEKGSGKTAICRAIKEKKNSATYFAIAEVNFDKVAFNALYEHLVELSATTHISRLVMLSNFWKFSLISELIFACDAHSSDGSYRRLAGLLRGTAPAASLPERLLRLLENCWNKIDVFTGTERGHNKDRSPAANLIASRGLTARLLEELRAYPLDKRFEEIKSSFYSLLRAHRHRVIILLDGFDLLRSEAIPREGVRLIFESLIAAIYSISCDSELPDELEVKALIPHDRYLGLTLGDSDKIDSLHMSIRWDRHTLRAFLEKRLQLHPRLVSSTFPSLWREVMPERVQNSRYKIDEDSYEYLLRHTMYRPRHLQVYLGDLAKSYKGMNIQPSMIPRSVADSAKKIAKYFVDEFRADHPSLGKFIASLGRRDNVMEYKHFRKLVADAIVKYARGAGTQLDVETKVDALYVMGFFGVVKFLEEGEVSAGEMYFPPTRDSIRHYVDFYYKDPKTGVSDALTDDALIALHPIIVDAAELRPHPSLIVG